MIFAFDVPSEELVEQLSLPKASMAVYFHHVCIRKQRIIGILVVVFLSNPNIVIPFHLLEALDHILLRRPNRVVADTNLCCVDCKIIQSRDALGKVI